MHLCAISPLGTLVAVSAVRGATARLPCDVTAPNADDPVLLVLWYKNASVTPVYSYDSRGKVQSSSSRDGTSATLNTRQGRRRNFGSSSRKTQKLQQWGDEEIWGFPQTNTDDKETSPESEKNTKNSFLGPGRRPRTRAWFDTSTSPAHLLIRDVSGRDEGSYRCKVHFRHSPSWSQRITLSVKDPPGFPRIQTESGARLEGPIGPFEDGTEIHIVCVSAGGAESAPRLAWSGPEGTLQKNAGPSKPSDPPNLIRLKMTASRSTADSSITCSAVNSTTHNSSLTPTNAVEVIIRVNLAPLSVTLVVPRSPISGGSESRFLCRAVGARPHTEVQWWLAGRQLTQNIETVSERHTLPKNKALE
ncbi:Immunoglobulin-like domain [Trinorchestia longiramus]|nr:Immunoglobulin-like domain [Trinorchestia longiramus]